MKDFADAIARVPTMPCRARRAFVLPPLVCRHQLWISPAGSITLNEPGCRYRADTHEFSIRLAPLSVQSRHLERSNPWDFHDTNALSRARARMWGVC